MADPRPAPPAGEPAVDRLDSWKEIAAYLKRGERTVRRWEQTEGLPVHRHSHQKQATVYAIRSELDLWLEQRRLSADKPDPELGDPALPNPGRRRLAIGFALVTVAVAALGIALSTRSSRGTATDRRTPALPATSPAAPPPVESKARPALPPDAEKPKEPKSAPAPPPASLAADAQPVFRLNPLTTFPGSERQPSFSPDGKAVAFSWDREAGGTWHIFTLPVPGANPRQLTSQAADDQFPAWSPDGKSIAFLRLQPGSPTQVVLVPAASGPERVVGTIRPNPRNMGQQTSAGSWIAWSPDGRWLVVPDRPSPQEPLGLFLLSVASGEKRRVTTGTDFAAAFSPDGRHLAYIQAPGAGFTLFLLTLDESYGPAGNPRRLTFDGFASSPVWMPNGRTILYAGGELWGSRSLFELEVLPEPGPAPGTPLPIEINDSTFFTASFADPRGMQLAYERPYFDPNIWALELGDNGKPARSRPVAPSTRVDFFPHLSPDGKWFTFTSTRSGHQEIWVAKSDGTEVRQLTFLESTAGVSRWSPDGRWIVFIAGRPKTANYVVSAAGGEPRRICNGQIASWSADSRSIYYISSDRTGRTQIWKTAVDQPAAEPLQITVDGGNAAFESPDGRAVYVNNNGIWKVTPSQHAEERIQIPILDWTSWAVVADGIVFVSRRNTIDHYRFATGETNSIATIEKPAFPGITVSSDGKTILYSQVDRDECDLMIARKRSF